MRYMKIATAALLTMAALPGLAQGAPLEGNDGTRPGYAEGTRDSLPRSNKSSNITNNDTRSNIAPTLPPSPVGIDGGPREYLRAARASLVAGHTGRAQQSLEMAQTRALEGSATPEQAKMPSSNLMVSQIRDALHALGDGQRARAIQLIDVALAG